MGVDSMRNPMEQIFPFPMEDTRGFPLTVLCIGRSHWRGPHRVRRRHSDLCALEYVHSGTGLLVENGSSFKIQQNDLFILHPGSDHDYSVGAGEMLVKTWIAVRGPLLPNLLQLYRMEDLYHAVGCRDLAPRFANLLSMGEAAFAKNSRSQQIAQEAALLLHGIVGDLAARTRAWEKNDRADTAGMRRHIEDHLAEDLSLAVIAAAGHCSISQAVRRFKKDTGQTPHDYLLARRMEMAEFYLRDTTLGVGEVARKIGFGDEHYFSRAFKIHSGKTPSRFRQEVHR